MKKVMILLVSVLMISLISCSKTEDIKQSWIFTITTVQSISPAMEGYPITNVTTIEQNNLTEDEANQAIAGANLTQTMKNGEYTITTTITATKALKK